MQDRAYLALIIMKFLKKVGAGLLLSLGFFCLMIAISELVDRDKTPQKKSESLDTAIGGIAFGVPMMAAGGWIVRGFQKQHQKNNGDRLQAIFYQLVQQKQGHISVLSFAIAAQIMIEEAKQYLNKKAQELNATFENNEGGEVNYYFDI